MAIINDLLSGFCDDAVTFSLDYDNDNLEFQAVNISNKSDCGCSIAIFRYQTQLYEVVIPSHSEISCNVPPGIEYKLDAKAEKTLGNLTIYTKYGVL